MARPEDGVYLVHASQKSYSMHIESGATDAELDEFIQVSNPGLYAKLLSHSNHSADYTQGATALSSIPKLNHQNSDGNIGDKPEAKIGKSVQCTRQTSFSAPTAVPGPGRDRGSYDYGMTIAAREINFEYESPDINADPIIPSERLAHKSTASYKAVQLLEHLKALREDRAAVEDAIIRKVIAATHQTETAGLRCDTWDRDLQMRHLKREILAKLQGGHVFVLQRVPRSTSRVRSHQCVSHLCPNHSGIARDTYRLSLEPRENLAIEVAPDVRIPSESKQSDPLKWFCLNCIEKVFGGVDLVDQVILEKVLRAGADSEAPVSESQEEEESHPPFAKNPLTSSTTIDATSTSVMDLVGRFAGYPSNGHDGASDMQFIAAAETSVDSPNPGSATPSKLVSLSDKYRGHSGFERSLVDTKERLPFELPSNSSQAMALRQVRATEIDLVLQMLENIQQKAQKMNNEAAENCGEPSGLKIRAPVDLPPPKERYRKKGLMSTDKYPWSTHPSRQKTASPAAQKAKVALVDLGPERFCYCREADDGEAMVQCCAELCLIGWIHLACSGLRTLPLETETWYCKHCADVHGPGNYVDREGSTFSGLPDLDSQVSTTASNADEEIETPTSPPDDFSTFPEQEVEGADPSTSEQGAYDGPSSPIHNLNSSFDMLLALPMNVDGSSDTATPPSPASIAQYIYPETRVSSFALSVPQQAALDKWKAKVAYDDLQAALSSPDKINRGIVDHNLHLRYPESVGLLYIKGPPVLGCMEQGGQVVELSTDEMDGKKLSECLKLVDSRVKAEQERIAGAREPWEEGVLQRMEWVKQEDEKAEARKIKKKEREMRASGGRKAVGSPSARLGDSSELTVTPDGGIEL